MAGTIADYSTTAIALALAAKFGPDIVKALFRKNGNGNGVCKANEALPIHLGTHMIVLQGIRESNEEIRDAVLDGNKGIAKLVTVMEDRRGRT